MIYKEYNLHKFLVKDLESNKYCVLQYNSITGSLIDKTNYRVLHKGNCVFNKPLKTPKVLSIVLGVKCNLHCSYCIQKDSRNKLNIDFSPKKIDSFLDKLKKLNLTDLDKILFWGGEPLVYWKTLNILLPKLKKLFPSVKDFFISTNGTLLSKNKLKFLLENGVDIQISDDIFNKERNVDLNKIYPLLLWAKREYPDRKIYIHSCFSNEFPDIYKLMHKAEKLLPGFTDFRGVPISPPLSMDNWFNTSAFFSLSDARLLESSLYKYITECNNTELKNLKIKQVLSGNIYNSFACRFANQVEICVDVKGNLYACRGSFEPFNIIGNIDSFKYPIETNKFKSFNNRAYCRNCPLVGICKGICSQVPDRIVKKYCLSHYAYQRANLRIMLKLKFNMELLKIINNDFDKQFQHNLSYDDLIKSINKPNIIHISKAT